MYKGQIVKALSGFYYVKTEDRQTYQTRARGVFRNQDFSPLVGDFVEFQLDENDLGYILAVDDRKNYLDRPPLANIDLGVIICSVVDPNFSSQLLDRFLAYLKFHHIDPVIYITKVDLASKEDLQEIQKYVEYYQKIGYPVILQSQGSIDDLMEFFPKKLAMFVGQSGAGKSTLLNKILPELDLKTGETSKSLGRGKHTTRHVELVELNGGQVADTPGFSAISLEEMEKEDLSQTFPEIWDKRSECKFSGCLHLKEPKCAVKNAVHTGEIPEFRYNNYLTFLNELIHKKPRYR